MYPEVGTYWQYIDSSVKRILICLNGLSDEDLNWRPIDSANSLYVLATHTMGNVEENLLGVLTGQNTQRQRDAEFAAQAGSVEALYQRRAALQSRVGLALGLVEPSDLDQEHEHPRRGPLTGRAVLIVGTRHAAEHMGQAELTRDMLYSARGSALPRQDP